MNSIWAVKHRYDMKKNSMKHLEKLLKIKHLYVLA